MKPTFWFFVLLENPIFVKVKNYWGRKSFFRNPENQKPFEAFHRLVVSHCTPVAPCFEWIFIRSVASDFVDVLEVFLDILLMCCEVEPKRGNSLSDFFLFFLFFFSFSFVREYEAFWYSRFDSSCYFWCASCWSCWSFWVFCFSSLDGERLIDQFLKPSCLKIEKRF